MTTIRILLYIAVILLIVSIFCSGCVSLPPSIPDNTLIIYREGNKQIINNSTVEDFLKVQDADLVEFYRRNKIILSK